MKQEQKSLLKLISDNHDSIPLAQTETAVIHLSLEEKGKLILSLQGHQQCSRIQLIAAMHFIRRWCCHASFKALLMSLADMNNCLDEIWNKHYAN